MDSVIPGIGNAKLLRPLTQVISNVIEALPVRQLENWRHDPHYLLGQNRSVQELIEHAPVLVDAADVLTAILGNQMGLRCLISDPESKKWTGDALNTLYLFGEWIPLANAIATQVKSMTDFDPAHQRHENDGKLYLQVVKAARKIIKAK